MTTSAKSAAVNRATDEVGSLDPRDVFMRDPDQPSRPERQFVHDRDRDYTLNGSESRTLDRRRLSRQQSMTVTRSCSINFRLDQQAHWLAVFIARTHLVKRSVY